MLAVIVLALVGAVVSQDVVTVDCGPKTITVKLDIGVAEKANLEIGDIHLNDNSCVFTDEGDGFIVRRINPFTSCGTTYTVNDTHVKYSNSLSTVDTGATYPFGVVVGQPDNEKVISAMIQCEYNIDLRVSTMFKPNITYEYITLPNAFGEGEFEARMALYTDERYVRIHDEAPWMQPDELLYVGVTLIGEDISSDIYLLLEDCWATVLEDPDSTPQYPLIAEGCPVESAAKESVRISNNGLGHQARWQSAVFRFVGEGPEYANVWLHCDLRLCVAESCAPECKARAARRKRRGVNSFVGGSESNIVSIGPITRPTTIQIDPAPSGVGHVYINNGTATRNQGVGNTGMSPALLVTTGALAALCLICITVAAVLIALRMRRSSRNAEMVNSGNINKAFNT